MARGNGRIRKPKVRTAKNMQHGIKYNTLRSNHAQREQTKNSDGYKGIQRVGIPRNQHTQLKNHGHPRHIQKASKQQKPTNTRTNERNQEKEQKENKRRTNRNFTDNKDKQEKKKQVIPTTNIHNMVRHEHKQSIKTEKIGLNTLKVISLYKKKL